MSDDTSPSGGEYQPNPDQAAENRLLKATIERLEQLCGHIESEHDDLRERLERSEQERRSRSWDKALSLVAALVGAIIGGICTLLGSYYATRSQAEAQIQEQQRKVFASLAGERTAWEGSNIFLADAGLNFAYFQERWRRAGLPDTSQDLADSRN
jgi:cell division protein FtsB